MRSTAMSEGDGGAAAELKEVMETTMRRLRDRFEMTSGQLESNIDQMGRRIKDLEKNVAELMSQAGMEASSDVSESV
ncbi:heat shock factor-binding protein 1-like protein 1 [Oryzias melastigma]|uniref:heat shock factor-binding protein 1-like protein 1 n=1 Tax=Oryzias melastigma TaxID=30732 RepID=UPI000CF7F957|nr:heat shock factor-binding protein 1-like protein 1 [Oryzias melastigma]